MLQEVCGSGVPWHTLEMATGSLLLELERRFVCLCLPLVLPSWCFLFLPSRLYTPLTHRTSRHAGGKTGHVWLYLLLPIWSWPRGSTRPDSIAPLHGLLHNA